MWQDLIGQEFSVKALQQAAHDSKEALTGKVMPGFSQAWLLTGPPGSGRSTAARLFAATLQVFIIFASSWVAVCLQCLFFTPISVSSLVADFSPRKVFDHRHGFTCSLTRYLTHSPLTRFASHILRSQTSGAEHKCNDPSTALELRPYSCGRHSCH